MLKWESMGKKKIYTIIFTAFFAICAFGLIWSWWVTRDIRSNVEDALSQSQQVDVKNLVLTETKDGKKYWELYAKTGEYDSAAGLVNLNEIIGNFYNKDEEVVLSFESPKGSYFESEKVITLTGETLIVAKDGSSITANKFVWKGQNEDIVASEGVTINRNNELITKSDEAVFNSELTYFKVRGKTKSSIYEKVSGGNNNEIFIPERTNPKAKPFEKMPEVIEVKK